MNKAIAGFLLVTLCSGGIAGAQLVSLSNDSTVRFRNIFSTLAAKNSQNRRNHLIFASPSEMFAETNFVNDQSCAVAESPQGLTPDQLDGRRRESDARQMLCKMQKSYSALNAQNLFDDGSQLPYAAEDLRALTSNLKSKDLLIVVVSGIFSEFFKSRAFEEIFSKVGDSGKIVNDSKFAKEWRDALTSKTAQEIGSAKNCPKAANSVTVCDDQEKLARVTGTPGNTGKRRVPMAGLLDVASLDDKDGTIAAKVVLFHLDGMTLESLGTQKNGAAIFTRRLNKFFSIMGGNLPKNIAFVGYSRGAPFVLEMLSQAEANHEPWLANVKAMVSLGGVVWGSATADEALMHKDAKLNCQVELIKTLAAELKFLPKPREALATTENQEAAAYNRTAWWEFLLATAKLNTRDNVKCADIAHSTAQESLWSQGSTVAKWIGQALAKKFKNSDSDDSKAGLNLLVAEAIKFGLYSDTDDDGDYEAEVNSTTMLEQLLQMTACPLQFKSLDACLNDSKYTLAEKYNRDVNRLLRLEKATLEGVTELTTDSRLQWWREHTIPTQTVRYYSISGTMADPKTSLGSNHYGFNPGSPDDNTLVKGWQDFQKVELGGEYAGISLNDSQVAVNKTVFWPKMIASLRAQNSAINSTQLAVVGTHHWGLTMPYLNPTNGKKSLPANPFPRRELIQAIALSIAKDIQ